MARLIDADALEVFVKTVRQRLYLDKTLSDILTRESMLLNFQQYIHLQPTIDAMPVVRGEWIAADDIGDCCYRCSECEFIRDAYLLDIGSYCPNCGARMNGERRNDDA